MTDITELALIDKIQKQLENFDTVVLKEDEANALVEALEKAWGMESYWKTQCRGITDHCEELQARIAELESRTVEVLTPEMRNALKAEGLADVLKDASEYAPLTAGQWETLTKNWHQTFIGLSDPAAGIKVETDSVDPDVSNRNQPGMIVAVHIDVGDFVKFRGRVYEVKETDFDDHDVTLWFVCGEVLKCAAGCPIEVVSALGETE